MFPARCNFGSMKYKNNLTFESLSELNVNITEEASKGSIVGIHRALFIQERWWNILLGNALVILRIGDFRNFVPIVFGMKLFFGESAEI